MAAKRGATALTGQDVAPHPGLVEANINDSLGGGSGDAGACVGMSPTISTHEVQMSVCDVSQAASTRTHRENAHKIPVAVVEPEGAIGEECLDRSGRKRVEEDKGGAWVSVNVAALTGRSSPGSACTRPTGPQGGVSAELAATMHSPSTTRNT